MKLHLGCGKRYIPGFVHVDREPHAHVEHCHDVRSLPFLPDGAAELIYACHVLEYFDRTEVAEVLAEWRRVLCPGGVLRLAVPDFAALVEVYLRHGDLDRVHGPLYGRWAARAGDPASVIHHRTVYDFATLSRTLRAAGFAEVRRYDWRETEHAAHDDYSQAYVPHMAKDDGVLVSLNVEAVRR